MMELPRISAWMGAARGHGEAYFVVEIGHSDTREEWHSETLEGACEGLEGDAAQAGLLKALATLATPSRVGVAVTEPCIAKALRALVRDSIATRPHVVSITCVSATAIYAAAAVECTKRARELACEPSTG
jgi:hypothetical protein